MDNQKKIELEANFTKWQASINTQILDCPRLLHIFANLNPYSVAPIFNANFKPIIDIKSKANLERLFAVKYDLENLIEYKITEAQNDNKKLLIIMGESHQTQYSYLFELVIATILKKYNFSHLMVEETTIDVSDAKKTTFPYVAKYVLGYDLLPINSAVKNPEERAKKINEKISLADQGNYLCQVGSNHLGHIKSAEEIKSKFNILPIDLSINEDILPKNIATKLKNIRSDQEAPQDVYRVKIEESMEQFSMKKINEIYQGLFIDIFPSADQENFNYISDLNTLASECIIFSSLIEATSMIKMPTGSEF